MDTVSITFTQRDYVLTDPRRFTPYFSPFDPYNTDERIRFLQEYKGHKRYTQNPSPEYRKQGTVYPNLRIDESFKRGIYRCDLKVSISFPKMLWGHSFEEVTDGHFSIGIDLLTQRLKDMGVIVTKNAAIQALGQTVNYCANILFSSEAEARMFLGRMSKASLGEWFENNARTYSNDGNAVRFRTDTFEIVFYLKYYDVLEKENRAVSPRTTPQEKEAVKRLLSEDKLPPVVRMEVRCNGSRSIRTHLRATLGIDKQSWTFQELFNTGNSRRVLLYYWRKIIDDPLNHVVLTSVIDEDICLSVLGKYKEEKLRHIVEAMGLFYFLKSLGVKGTREVVVLKHSRKIWYDKRKKIISFAKSFTKPDEALINIVTKVLENKPRQLGLPL